MYAKNVAVLPTPRNDYASLRGSRIEFANSTIDTGSQILERQITVESVAYACCAGFSPIPSVLRLMRVAFFL